MHECQPVFAEPDRISWFDCHLPTFLARIRVQNHLNGQTIWNWWESVRIDPNRAKSKNQSDYSKSFLLRSPFPYEATKERTRKKKKKETSFRGHRRMMQRRSRSAPPPDRSPYLQALKPNRPDQWRLSESGTNWEKRESILNKRERKEIGRRIVKEMVCDRRRWQIWVSGIALISCVKWRERPHKSRPCSLDRCVFI